MNLTDPPDKCDETNWLPLYESLRENLAGNAAKLKLFAMLTLGIIIHRTVNLARIALVVTGETRQKSLYRRLQRFFQDFSFPAVQFGRLLLNMLAGEKNALVLAMDRTNWKFGRVHINILQIGIVTSGVLYPLVWMTLPQTTKRGNSNTAQRIRLMEKLLQIVPAGNIRCLLADREFIGNDWLGWLDGRGIPFVVRLKSNMKLDGRSVLELAGPGQWRNHRETTYGSLGCPVRFAAKELADKDDRWLLLIANRHTGEELAGLYKLRWGIECFFSHLKSRGFNFEDTHLTAGDRIDKLLAALALAFVFSHRKGLEREIEKKRL